MSTLAVLLIEDSPQYAHLVQHWLSAATGGAAFRLSWADSLAAGIKRLEQGGIDVILLDLGLPDGDGIETFAQLRTRAGKTPILVLSSADNESLALETIREGGEDYLVKSSCNGEILVRSVRHAVVRRQSHRNAAEGGITPSRLIGVVGSKGGVGTTTIACNLASELRLQTDQKVLLMDLDSAGGNVPFVVDVECRYSLLDAVHSVEQLDLDCWQSIVAQGLDDLHVVSSPGSSNGKLKQDDLRGVLAFAQTIYPWIVLDLGRVGNACLELAGRLTEVLAVTTTTIPALYNAKRAIETLLTAMPEADRIRLIVNHVGEVEPLPRSALNNMFGVPIYAAVPNDADELHAASVDKRLAGKRSHFRKAIAGLVRNLAGLPEQPRKGKLAPFVSLAERFRKSPEAVASR